MIGDNVRRKIEDLIARAPALVGDGDIPRNAQQIAECTAWLTEALNAIAYAIPSPQNPYRARIERPPGGTTTQRIASVAAILRALLPDIDAGLLGDLGNQIRAETFDNFLDHGAAYLDERKKLRRA